MKEESVYSVIHFKKKRWDILGRPCNGFKRQEKMCEYCIVWISRENEATGSTWDFVIVEELVGLDTIAKCQCCERREMAQQALRDKQALGENHD